MKASRGGDGGGLDIVNTIFPAVPLVVVPPPAVPPEMSVTGLGGLGAGSKTTRARFCMSQACRLWMKSNSQASHRATSVVTKKSDVKLN
jgi:hypothetical protein